MFMMRIVPGTMSKTMLYAATFDPQRRRPYLKVRTSFEKETASYWISCMSKGIQILKLRFTETIFD